MATSGRKSADQGGIGKQFCASIFSNLPPTISILSALIVAVAPVYGWITGYWSHRIEQEKLTHRLVSEFLSKMLDPKLELQDRILVFEALASLEESPMKNWATHRLTLDINELNTANSLARASLIPLDTKNPDKCKAQFEFNMNLFVPIVTKDMLKGDFDGYARHKKSIEIYTAESAAKCQTTEQDLRSGTSPSGPIVTRDKTFPPCKIESALAAKLKSEEFLQSLSAKRTGFMDSAVQLFEQSGVCGREQIAAILANFYYETANFRTLREFWGPTRDQNLYEGNEILGNVNPGDGKLFMQRGFLPVIGRRNYEDVGRAIGVDLVSKPELLGNDMNIALKAAFYILQKRDALSTMRADGTVDQVALRVKIAGGDEDIAPVISAYDKILKLL